MEQDNSYFKSILLVSSYCSVNDLLMRIRLVAVLHGMTHNVSGIAAVGNF